MARTKRQNNDEKVEKNKIIFNAIIRLKDKI